MYSARLKDDTSVANVISNGSWIWPQEWFTEYPILRSVNVPTLNEQSADKTLWKSCSGTETSYSVTQDRMLIWNPNAHFLDLI